MFVRHTPFALMIPAAVLAASLSACSSDDDDDTGGTTIALPGASALTADALQGAWSTGCALEDAGDAGDGYRLASLSFEGDAFMHSNVSFADAGCTVALPDDDDIELTGTFTLGGAVLLSDGLEATGIDLTATTASGTSARTLLDLVHVDGQTLYLGDGDFDDIRDTDADERPASLELDEPYTLIDPAMP